MTTTVARLGVRLNPADKDCIARAAALRGVSISAFVREAALREAESVIAHSLRSGVGSRTTCLSGRATARMSTDQIMRLTRDA